MCARAEDIHINLTSSLCLCVHTLYTRDYHNYPSVSVCADGPECDYSTTARYVVYVLYYVFPDYFRSIFPTSYHDSSRETRTNPTEYTWKRLAEINGENAFTPNSTVGRPVINHTSVSQDSREHRWTESLFTRSWTTSTTVLFESCKSSRKVIRVAAYRRRRRLAGPRVGGSTNGGRGVPTNPVIITAAACFYVKSQ